MTHRAEVKPCISAQVKVKKLLEYTKEKMILWTYFNDKTNGDADPETVGDLFGNRNDFRLKNGILPPPVPLHGSKEIGEELKKKITKDMGLN